ncbi:ABC transporter permease [Sphingomonas hankookensis]|uniref:ABC transporter permease n=1 Tax=Sphingomonas hengshuiensis TaxID=1609977 RepID=A0A2W4ZBU4_9SPHN|nr:MAG: ABC transporter permease [Sphingomonas hengshuiensis]
MTGRAFAGTFRAIFTDRAALLMLVGSAILYSFFYPTAYSGEVPTRLPVVAVDLDRTGSSRALVAKLPALQQADLVGRLSSPQEALEWIRARRASAAIVIPAGYERTILRGGQGTIALYGNGAYLLRSSTALTGIGAAIGAAGREAATDQAMATGAPAAPPLALVQRPLFNTREGYGSTVFPGVAFLIIQQTLLMGLALLAGTIRERHGRRRFAPGELLGIAAAFFVIGCCEVAYFTGFVFWFQDYPRAQAHPLTLLVAAASFVSALVAGSMLLASFFRTRERPIQLWVVTSLPVFFLSGLSWPVEATPGWLAVLARILPTTPGIHLMVGVNQMGASLRDQAPEVANLLIQTAVYGTLAFMRWRRVPDRTSSDRP